MNKWFLTRAFGGLLLAGSTAAAQPAPLPLPLPSQPAPAVSQPAPVRTGTINTPVMVRTLADDSAKPEKIAAPTHTGPTTADTFIGSLCQPSCARGCEPCGSLVGGVGIDVLKPHFTKNPAYTRFVENGADETFQVDHDWDYKIGFHIWVGYVSCDGFGGRLRYREFDSRSNRLTATVEAGETIFGANSYRNNGIFSDEPGDTFEFVSNLKYDVIDLEATQNLKFGGTNVILVGGLRYAYMNQNYLALEFDDGEFLDRVTQAGHNFRGFGPTVGVEAYRGLCGGLTLYATSRASLLFGDATYNGAELDGNLDVVRATRVETDALIPILEAEIGVQVTADFCGGRVFGQIGLRGEAWIGGNNASRAAAGDHSAPSDEVGIDSLDVTDFGLIGLMLRVGIDY